MEDEQIVTSSTSQNSFNGISSDRTNKALIAVIVVLLIFLVGGGAYFLGTKQSGNSTSVTPTPTTSLQTLNDIVTQQPLAQPTSTPSVTAKPTPPPTSTPSVKSKTITSTASLDGFRSNNNGGNAGVDIRAGRNMYLVSRGFVSFDLNDIPSGSTITEASLRLYQIKTIGSPYSVGGKLMVDDMNYGTTLENDDYSTSAITSNLVSLTANTTVEWKDAIVTEAVKKDLAEGRTRAQYRLHFETEAKGGDSAGDFAYFESADNSEGSGNLPQLVVKYY